MSDTIIVRGKVQRFDPAPAPCNPERPMPQCNHCGRRNDFVYPGGSQVVIDASVMATSRMGECLMRMKR